MIYRYKIEKSRIKLVGEHNNFKNMAEKMEDEKIILVKLLARPREEQDSLIALFYASWNSVSNKCQLSIKEMYREMDGNIVVKEPVYLIM
jgi:hypothetical protein